MPDNRKKVLILGGTGEARQLAEQAVTAFPSAEIITSYAGRTSRPQDPPGTIREGGFGGTRGLADYIQREDINLVVDATHPFAEVISEHAHDACLMAQVQRLLVVRPPWVLPPPAKWVELADMQEAADALSGLGRRVFLTTGTQELNVFAGNADVWFLVRLIAGPPAPLPLDNHEVVLGRPPFTLDEEKNLMSLHRIDTLVSKQSGGPIPAKIQASLDLQVPIVLIQPPAPPPGNRVDNLEDALKWIETQL